MPIGPPRRRATDCPAIDVVARVATSVHDALAVVTVTRLLSACALIAPFAKTDAAAAIAAFVNGVQCV